jgi:lipoprotein-anchoring transpeptidase ErfK/SrfK
MKRTNWMLLSFIGLALTLIVSTAWAKQEGQEQTKKGKVELPPAVVKAIKANVPDAEIAMAEVEKEAGISLYDIEFKAGKGEIEVAEDGTVMDVATIITMKDVPKAAAEAIQKAVGGATITQLEKSEVRAEIKKKEEKGTIVILASPKYVYEAELAKSGQKGEIQVTADGKVIEGPKWSAKKDE